MAGRRPIEGEEYQELYEQATSRDRPTLRARGARVSDAFEAMIAKAVALMPNERYPDADEMLRAMDAIARASAPLVEPRACRKSRAPPRWARSGQTILNVHLCVEQESPVRGASVCPRRCPLTVSAPVTNRLPTRCWLACDHWQRTTLPPPPRTSRESPIRPGRSRVPALTRNGDIPPILCPLVS